MERLITPLEGPKLRPAPTTRYDPFAATLELFLPVGTPTVSKLAEADNATLLTLCAAGNQAAWSRLVSRYENLVFSVALSCGLAREDAEDVYQQVWLEVHRSLGRIRNPQALPQWLIVSTRRLCYRQSARSARNAGTVSAELVDPTALPDAMVEAFESRRVLEWGLAKLGGPCAKLLRMLFLRDAKPSYQAISRETGLAVGSIGPIRARCLKRLRKLMEEPA